MTTAGTYYYPPSAGTGNLLLSNPPFIFQSMDTNQPTPKWLPELTEAEFLRLSAAAGGNGHPFEACNYGHALRIAQLAFTAGADLELEACCKWMDSFDPCWDYVDDLRAACRPESPPPPFVASEEEVPAPQPGEWRSMPAPSEDDAGSDGKVWAWVSGQPATRLHWHNARHLMLCKRLSFWAPGNRPAPTSPPLVSMTDGHGAKAEPALPPDVVGSQEVAMEPEALPEPGEPRAVVEHQRTGYSRLERFMLHGMPDDTGPQWIIGRVPTEDDADSDGFVVVSVRYAALYAPAKCSARWACVHLGTPWAPVNAIPGTPFDPTCLDRNGWIRSRLPTVEDTGYAGHVLIPLGNGGTTSTIAYDLIVPGQPWAPWGSNPGRFEK